MPGLEPGIQQCKVDGGAICDHEIAARAAHKNPLIAWRQKSASEL
jgi:hypothetical protein